MTNTQEQLNTKTQELTNTREELNTLQHVLDTREEEFETTTVQLRRKQRELESTTQQRRNIQQCIVECENMANNLMKYVEGLKDVKKELEDTNKQLEDTNKELEDTNKQLETDKDNLTQSIKENEDELQKLEDELEKLEEAKDLIWSKMNDRLDNLEQAVLKQTKTSEDNVIQEIDRVNKGVCNVIQENTSTLSQQVDDVCKTLHNLPEPDLNKEVLEESLKEYKETLEESTEVIYNLHTEVSSSYDEVLQITQKVSSTYDEVLRIPQIVSSKCDEVLQTYDEVLQIPAIKQQNLDLTRENRDLSNKLNYYTSTEDRQIVYGPHTEVPYNTMQWFYNIKDMFDHILGKDVVSIHTIRELFHDNLTEPDKNIDYTSLQKAQDLIYDNIGYLTAHQDKEIKDKLVEVFGPRIKSKVTLPATRADWLYMKTCENGKISYMREIGFYVDNPNIVLITRGFDNMTDEELQVSNEQYSDNLNKISVDRLSGVLQNVNQDDINTKLLDIPVVNNYTDTEDYLIRMYKEMYLNATWRTSNVMKYVTSLLNPYMIWEHYLTHPDKDTHQYMLGDSIYVKDMPYYNPIKDTKDTLDYTFKWGNTKDLVDKVFSIHKENIIIDNLPDNLGGLDSSMYETVQTLPYPWIGDISNTITKDRDTQLLDIDMDILESFEDLGEEC